MAKGHIYIGTSGWHYKHWKHVFYPNEVKNADQLSFYMQSFNTVELNNSFYRVPTEQAFDKWKDTVPNDFRFAVKANRYITHRKKLHEVNAATDDFIHRASRLGNKLGPILFQLPPNWKINIDRLGSFLAALPPHHRYTFEFRNPSWYTESLYQLLRRYTVHFVFMSWRATILRSKRQQTLFIYVYMGLVENIRDLIRTHPYLPGWIAAIHGKGRGRMCFFILIMMRTLMLSLTREH